MLTTDETFRRLKVTKFRLWHENYNRRKLRFQEISEVFQAELPDLNMLFQILHYEEVCSFHFIFTMYFSNIVFAIPVTKLSDIFVKIQIILKTKIFSSGQCPLSDRYFDHCEKYENCSKLAIMASTSMASTSINLCHSDDFIVNLQEISLLAFAFLWLTLEAEPY